MNCFALRPLCLCGENYFFNNAYSNESTSACKEASMMFSLTPTVPHSRLPSLDVINLSGRKFPAGLVMNVL
jgi:hypothetical protein